MSREELLKSAQFKVSIKSPAFSVQENGVDYDTARALLDKAESLNAGNVHMQERVDCARRAFGFGGMGGRDYSVTLYAGLPRVSTGEKMLCDRRTEGGPVHMDPTKELPDEWELIGGDRVCSYCGSLHPERVLELIREKGFGIIDRSDKNYKWYINRADVPNAGFGGIKYYRQHDTPEFIAGFNDLVNPPMAPTPSVAVPLDVTVVVNTLADRNNIQNVYPGMPVTVLNAPVEASLNPTQWSCAVQKNTVSDGPTTTNQDWNPDVQKPLNS